MAKRSWRGEAHTAIPFCACRNAPTTAAVLKKCLDFQQGRTGKRNFFMNRLRRRRSAGATASNTVFCEFARKKEVSVELGPIVF